MHRSRLSAIASGTCALCVAVAVACAPAVTAEAVIFPVPPALVAELPVLSELPPLPGEDEPAGQGQNGGSSESAMSGVQQTALALALGVFVVGGLGLALVTRRSRTGVE